MTPQKRLMRIAKDISRRKTQYAKRNLILKWCEVAKQVISGRKA